MNFCSRCGAKLTAGDEFCSSCGMKAKSPESRNLVLTFQKKFEFLAIWIFRIIAIPFSVWWFFRSLYLIFSGQFEGTGILGVVLSLSLPVLLFKAAISTNPPWKNETLKRFLGIFFIVFFVAAAYIGLGYFIIKVFQPYLGETFSAILFFVIFIGSAVFLLDYLPDFLKKHFKKK